MIKDLGNNCVPSIFSGSDSLVEITLYLVNYQDIYYQLRGLCNNISSRVPNSIIHHKLGINSSFDTSRSVTALRRNWKRSIIKHRRRAILSLNLENIACQSPPSEYINSMSHLLMIRILTQKSSFSVARVGDKTWWCWNISPMNDRLRLNNDRPMSVYIHLPEWECSISMLSYMER
jgi:hypothetical protein